MPRLDSLIAKAVVTLTIEQALLEIGGCGLLNKVLRILHGKCRCYLPDCFDKPENFSKVWNELDEGTCTVMVNMVKEKLEEFSHQKSIDNFIINLSKVKCVQR